MSTSVQNFLKKRVLIVDDDPISRTFAEAALKKKFEVHQESSGAQAAGTVARLRPDVVILDLHMPNVDGYEVLRTLKSNPATGPIPVICLSADSVQESRDRAVTLGAAAYFQKPIDVRTLAEDIESFLQSLETVLQSANGQFRFVVMASHFEKLRSLKSDLIRRLRSGERCIVMSLMNGSEFIDAELEPFLVSKELIYLQVSASTIAKIPFLQDFRPVVDDIVAFLDRSSKEYALFMDDPRAILSADGSTASAARVQSLKGLFTFAFASINCFASREGLSSLNSLNDLASVMTR